MDYRILAITLVALSFSELPKAEAGGCVPQVAVVALPMNTKGLTPERVKVLTEIHEELQRAFVVAVDENPQVELQKPNLKDRTRRRLQRLLRPVVARGATRPPAVAYKLVNGGGALVDTVIVYGIDLGKTRSFRASVLGLYGGTTSLHFASDTIFSRSPDQEPEGPALGAIFARAAENTHCKI